MIIPCPVRLSCSRQPLGRSTVRVSAYPAMIRPRSYGSVPTSTTPDIKISLRRDSVTVNRHGFPAFLAMISHTSSSANPRFPDLNVYEGAPTSLLSTTPALTAHPLPSRSEFQELAFYRLTYRCINRYVSDLSFDQEWRREVTVVSTWPSDAVISSGS